MFADSRGHTITCNSAEVATSCALAMDHYMERKSDVAAQLQSAIEQDPECAFAHAVMGLMLHGAKHIALQPMMMTSLENAKKYSSGISEREQSYVDALSFASVGQLENSVACYERILEKNPTDGFALSLCQAELFWLGDMDRSLAASTSVSDHWTENVSGYSEYLGMHAFDLEEAGQYDKAERVGRNAVELNTSNIWATHAVAHVLYMQGRHSEGVDWISGVQGNWEGVGQMQFHVWWHKCLFHIERAEFDAALDGYDSWVRNKEHELVKAMPDLYIDLQNGASLLWRLELHGVDVGTRWNEMAELVATRVSDLSSPFTSAHFAIILAAVGNFDLCNQLIEAMEEFTASTDKTLSAHYAKGAVPAAKAAVAHRQGDYAEVVSLLYPVRFNLGMMGGSHAQQDLFYQILLDAVARTQDKQAVDLLLNEIEQIGFVEPAQLSAYRLIALR